MNLFDGYVWGPKGAAIVGFICKKFTEYIMHHNPGKVTAHCNYYLAIIQNNLIVSLICDAMDVYLSLPSIRSFTGHPAGYSRYRQCGGRPLCSGGWAGQEPGKRACESIGSLNTKPMQEGKQSDIVKARTKKTGVNKTQISSFQGFILQCMSLEDTNMICMVFEKRFRTTDIVQQERRSVVLNA